MEILHAVEIWCRLLVDAGACITFAFLVYAARGDLRRSRRLARRRHAELLTQLEPVPTIAAQVGEIHAAVVK
jgi:hypothetical protein